MKVTGIVSEYNPFHYGHQYHIHKTRELTQCDVLINVMSGHFVQRGEASLAYKWDRARKGIEEGCDIVIELPYIYATQSADGFAYGAIRSLQLAGVDHIVFGSESNDLDALKQIAEITPAYDPSKSFAQSTQMQSNDILGVAYMKALKDTNITPLCIKRTNGYHDLAVKGNIASATGIRQRFLQKEDVSFLTPLSEALHACFAMEHYYPYLQMLLFTQAKQHLESIFLMEEGLENRMITCAKQCTTMKSFVDACISKRYTRSRIQRTILQILTQTTKQEVKQLSDLQHIRILAMNETGRAYIKQLKKTEVIIASRFNQIPKAYREMDLRAASAYAIPLSSEERLSFIKKELQSFIQVGL